MGSVSVFSLLVVRTSAWEATIRFSDRYVFVILFFRCRLFNNNAKGLQKLVKVVSLVVNQRLRHYSFEFLRSQDTAINTTKQSEHRRKFKRPNALAFDWLRRNNANVKPIMSFQDSFPPSSSSDGFHGRLSTTATFFCPQCGRCGR